MITPIQIRNPPAGCLPYVASGTMAIDVIQAKVDADGGAYLVSAFEASCEAAHAWVHMERAFADNQPVELAKWRRKLRLTLLSVGLSPED